MKRIMYNLFISPLIVITIIELTLVGLSWSQKSKDDNECPDVCLKEKCFRVTRCNAGVVRDKCGCCDVCGLEQGHLCNRLDETYNTTTAWYGICGVDLECRLRTDVDRVKVGLQSMCYCTKPGLACASDDKTYSLCQMEAKKIESNNTITMISYGPCKTEPKIVTVSKSEVVPQGTSATVMCEVEGYPIASIKWFFTQPESHDYVKMPGDSEEISVSVRGGPEPLRITSHLQITNFQSKHEGKYSCNADNDMGMDTKDLSLVLKPTGY